MITLFRPSAPEGCPREVGTPTIIGSAARTPVGVRKLIEKIHAKARTIKLIRFICNLLCAKVFMENVVNK